MNLQHGHFTQQLGQPVPMHNAIYGPDPPPPSRGVFVGINKVCGVDLFARTLKRCNLSQYLIRVRHLQML